MYMLLCSFSFRSWEESRMRTVMWLRKCNVCDDLRRYLTSCPSGFPDGLCLQEMFGCTSCNSDWLHQAWCSFRGNYRDGHYAYRLDNLLLLVLNALVIHWKQSYMHGRTKLMGLTELARTSWHHHMANNSHDNSSANRMLLLPMYHIWHQRLLSSVSRGIREETRSCKRYD